MKLSLLLKDKDTAYPDGQYVEIWNAAVHACEAALAQQAQEVCMCVDGAICGWCKKPFRIAQQVQPEMQGRCIHGTVKRWHCNSCEAGLPTDDTEYNPASGKSLPSAPLGNLCKVCHKPMPCWNHPK